MDGLCHTSAYAGLIQILRNIGEPSEILGCLTTPIHARRNARSEQKVDVASAIRDKKAPAMPGLEFAGAIDSDQ
jgi:hypothetical protein